MFWTVKQAALYLGCSEWKVYYLIYFGRIEAVQVGDAWRITPGSVRACGAKKAA